MLKKAYKNVLEKKKNLSFKNKLDKSLQPFLLYYFSLLDSELPSWLIILNVKMLEIIHIRQDKSCLRFGMQYAHDKTLGVKQ